MANKNIQMRKKNGSIWDFLYPKTIASNVYTTETTTIVDELKDIKPLTQADFENINTLIQAGKTIYLKGDYTLAHSINVLPDTTIIGLGNTVITFTVACDGIVFPNGCTRVRIENVRMTGFTNTSNNGLSFNEDNGGFDMIFKNIKITNFKNGIYAKDVLWCNTFSNFIIDNCDISVNIKYKSAGMQINNTFENIYSVKAISCHFDLSGLRQTVMNNINIGIANSEKCMTFGIGSYFINGLNCEQDTAVQFTSNYFAISLTDNCDVQIRNAEFVVNYNTTNNAYFVFVARWSRLTLENVYRKFAVGVTNVHSCFIDGTQEGRKIECIHSDEFLTDNTWNNYIGDKYIPVNRTYTHNLVGFGRADGITLGVTEITAPYDYLSAPCISVMPNKVAFDNAETYYVEVTQTNKFRIYGRSLTTGETVTGTRNIEYAIFN